MSSGKLLVGFMLASAIVMGGGVYYTQVYAYFDEVPADQVDLRLISTATGQAETLQAEALEAIDKTSSPLGFRACFTTSQTQEFLAETFQPMPDAIPLQGPSWFSCYDAFEVGTALERGEAMAFLGERNIRDGVDRVIAIMPDGRGFVWHQLNEKYKD